MITACTPRQWYSSAQWHENRPACYMKQLLYVAMAAAAVITVGCGNSREQRAGQQLSGLFLVHQDGKTGFVNKSGKVEIAPQFANAAPFSEGLAVVQIGNRAGYINEQGRIVINPQFDSGAPFSEGLAAVRVGNAWGFIDKKGDMVVQP